MVAEERRTPIWATSLAPERDEPMAVIEIEIDDADLTALDRVGQGTEPTRGPQAERRARKGGRISDRALHSRNARD